jgi:hypothetical protein
MPLLPGNDPNIISHNIGEMIKAGHPEDQAVAAAYSNARKHNEHAAMTKDAHDHLTQSYPNFSKLSTDKRFALAQHHVRERKALKAAGRHV